jgi:predicted MFS family arabinose efflux permease
MSSQTISRAPRAPLPFLGVACAVGVSTLYYNQPLLLEMGHSYGATAGHTGFVAVATQVGYAFGLLFFVPLGDVMERRSLIMRMFAAVSVALVLVASAPSLMWLIAASALAGLFSSVTHVVLPIAPDMVEEKERGRAIGIVMTGLLLGVLLARTFAGWLTKIHGWQGVFLAAAVMNLAFVPLLWKLMPKLPPKQVLRYGEAMQSLWTLWRTEPLLRESAILGGLIFGAFSCFWTTLTFLLDSHYGLGPGVAGSFGLVGAAGAMIAPVAGRLSDKRGSRYVVKAGIVIMAAAFLLVWMEERARLSLTVHMALMVVLVVFMDMGAQMTQVANQTRIFGLVPSARSRLNTVYMTVFFGGGALGSALATAAWVHWRWNGVSALALGLLALAGLRHAAGRGEGRRETGISPEVVEM